MLKLESAPWGCIEFLRPQISINIFQPFWKVKKTLVQVQVITECLYNCHGVLLNENVSLENVTHPLVHGRSVKNTLLILFWKNTLWTILRK